MSVRRLKKWSTHIHSSIIFMIAIICVLLGFFILRTPYTYIHEGQDSEELYIESEVFDRTKELEKLQQKVTSVRARAAVVYDMSTRTIIAEKGSTEVRSLASLTKLVTATLVYESYRSTTSRAIVLPRIQHMLTTSSNDEAQELAYAFSSTEAGQARVMNAYTKTYGMTFRNVSGLDIILDDGVSRQPSSAGTAASIARFAADTYTRYPEFFDTTIHTKENTNIAVNDISFMLGGKTGFTDLSGGNLMVIVQKGISHRYIVVVLGSTENGRFVDVEQIAHTLLQLHI